LYPEFLHVLTYNNNGFMGEMLRDQEMNTGGTAEKKTYRSHGATTRTPTLAEIGITKSMPSMAQKIADVGCTGATEMCYS